MDSKDKFLASDASTIDIIIQHAEESIYPESIAITLPQGLPFTSNLCKTAER